ncbi:MAG TPA: hypothetical protein VH599_16400 [Ktedonobacterales bacterium]|jgi:hypothetical protein
MEAQVLRGQVIHVNEDGWVVINRGAQDGVSEGLRFAVLGERKPRQIRDPFASAEATSEPASLVVLRADTVYELLRVILVERRCCVAISDRVPPERTPQPFLGPQGELLIYTPPPDDWRYDALDLEEESEDAPADEAAEGAHEDEAEGDPPEKDSASKAEGGSKSEAEDSSAADLTERQQERLWDGALPLNAVQVGDEVVVALPYRPGAGEAPAEATLPAAADGPTRPASYDWLKL